MHFFNPAPVLQFVEVIRTVITEPTRSSRTSRRSPSGSARSRSRRRQGRFIANALLFGYLNHAVAMFECKLRHPRGHRRRDEARLRLPDGPLALMDLIGLDTAYEILDTMYKQGRDRLHAPSPIIKQMVSAG